MRSEAILELPAPAAIQPVTRFRGTWLLASLQALRARGHYDAYLGHLSAASKESVLSVVATSASRLAAVSTTCRW